MLFSFFFPAPGLLRHAPPTGATIRLCGDASGELGCGAFDAAQWLYGRGAKSVCVLDFASDTTAGGRTYLMLMYASSPPCFSRSSSVSSWHLSQNNLHI